MPIAETIRIPVKLEVDPGSARFVAIWEVETEINGQSIAVLTTTPQYAYDEALSEHSIPPDGYIVSQK